LSGDAFDPTILVFAALAAFVLWRLSSVLGVRVERDPAPEHAPRRGPVPPPAPPVATPTPVAASDRWTPLAEPGSAAWAGLDAVAAADPAFSAKDFADGARRAYEMIVQAFAKGDRPTLERLLSKEVFDNFAGVIAAREARGETEETAVVAIESVTVEAARGDRDSAEIVLRIVARLMRMRRDKAGEELEGSGRTERVVDIWTFARAPHSPDPNWKLVATRTGE